MNLIVKPFARSELAGGVRALIESDGEGSPGLIGCKKASFPRILTFRPIGSTYPPPAAGPL
jgi:hypothetical protein